MDSIKKVLSFVSLILILTSCSKSKESDPEPEINTCDRITEVWSPAGGGSRYLDAQISYDDKGRPVNVMNTASSNFKYIYYQDRIELKTFDIDGKPADETFYLDKKGRIVKTSYFDYNFQYDAEGHLISYKSPYSIKGEIIGSDLYILTWKDGNYVALEPADGTLKTIRMDLKYSGEKSQDMMGFNSALYRGWVLGVRTYFLLIEAGFFGKQSKNMWSDIQIRGETHYGDPVQNQFDTKGRIISQTGGFAVKYACE